MLASARISTPALAAQVAGAPFYPPASAAGPVGYPAEPKLVNGRSAQ